MQRAADLIERTGGERKEQGLAAARALVGQFAHLSNVGYIPASERPAMRLGCTSLHSYTKGRANGTFLAW
jgi:hypothetical protein